MATVPTQKQNTDLTKPGGSYATNDPMTQASLIAMGARPATPDSLTMTAAGSKLNPGVIERGAVTGATPTGQGIASVPTEIQAYTAPVAVPDPNAAIAPSIPSAAPVVATPNTTPTATVPGAPTAGQAYAGILPTGNPELDAAYNAQRDSLKATQGPIDEQTIRNNTLAGFQAQIDALNQFYAQQLQTKLSAEDAVGKGQLGSNAAIQAARGMLGSSFGSAQTDTVNKNINDVRQSITDTVNADKNAAISSILTQVRTEANKTIADKQAAKAAGAQQYIDFLKGAEERKAANVSSAVRNLLASKANPTESDYSELAKALGIDPAVLKLQYDQTKATTEAAAKKAAQDAAPKPIVVGGVAYIPQPDGTLKPATPAPEDKPIVVGGIAYTKASDGTYQAVTPKPDVKPINRVVNKVLEVSLDGGITWNPAKGGAGVSARKGGGGSVQVKPVTDAKKIASTLAKVQSGIGSGTMTNENGNPIVVGSDGKLSPQDYLTIRNAWVKDGLNPTTFDTKMKGYRDSGNGNYATGK